MRHFSFATFVFLLSPLFASVGLAQEFPELPGPTKQHQWLQQFVGEWESEMAAQMPDQPAMKAKGVETVRSLGGFWIVADSKSDMMGETFFGKMTLGFDPEKQKYVGTWVDSMSGYLWTYEGEVDKSGKVLTLLTKGPCPQVPGRHTDFKEVLEIKSEDHKVFTSSMQDEDGNWITFLKIDYKRKK
ncbi:MAG: DUF1579 domain-containing protein [Pirellulaceae bacterium]